MTVNASWGRKSKRVIAVSMFLGGVIPVIFGILSVWLRESDLRATVMQPFFTLSSPVLELSEFVFGQAPIPILLFLICYWLLLGFMAGMLILFCSRKIHGNKEK